VTTKLELNRESDVYEEISSVVVEDMFMLTPFDLKSLVRRLGEATTTGGVVTFSTRTGEISDEEDELEDNLTS